MNEPESSLGDKLFVASQYILPKQALTQLMGALAKTEGGRTTHSVIRWFIKKYSVNMTEAANPNVESYASFNEFFTRPLKASARPQADAQWLCPVDGAISQFGKIQNDQIYQAKGHQYSTQSLVGGDAKLSREFDNGSFATLYLSPRDYHRIHMPCDGVLREMIYVPGALFSVNPATARGVPGLFARNERVVCVFDTAQGPFVLTLVGATIVGSMATVWHSTVNPPRHSEIKRWQYLEGSVALKKGDEMGRFLLGSTVVMLFPETFQMSFNASWKPGKSIRLNEAMGGFGLNR
jgi:phosphatidylserine decarboxylase